MSATFKVTVTKDRLDKIRALGPQQAAQFIKTAAFDGERMAKQAMVDSPPGNPYVRYKPTRTGNASRPGNAPRPDIGYLRNSIKASQFAPNTPLRWKIVCGAEYGVHLEFGTRAMAARPFMGPMAEALQKRVPALFNAFLKGI